MREKTIITLLLFIFFCVGCICVIPFESIAGSCDGDIDIFDIPEKDYDYSYNEQLKTRIITGLNLNNYGWSYFNGNIVAINPVISISEESYNAISNTEDNGNGYLYDFFSDTMPPIAYRISEAENSNLNGSDFEIYTYDVNDDSGVSAVRFAVWTDSNYQDDLKWHEGVDIGEGTWKAVIPINQHNNETGTYKIIAYAKDFLENEGVIGILSVEVLHKDELSSETKK